MGKMGQKVLNLKKKLGIKLIYSMQINIKISYKLILLFLVGKPDMPKVPIIISWHNLAIF